MAYLYLILYYSLTPYSPTAVGLLGLVTFLGYVKEKSYNNIVC
uniref:Uncharacterized protein n=1 Tax=virus sp. ct9pU4 TaxID=2828248 RepID=A0A8S5RBQ7_9VIRU|nr:MAG TPA: hypothetical protein [virus sp. ct9pU4]